MIQSIRVGLKILLLPNRTPSSTFVSIIFSDLHLPAKAWCAFVVSANGQVNATQSAKSLYIKLATLK